MKDTLSKEGERARWTTSREKAERWPAQTNTGFTDTTATFYHYEGVNFSESSMLEEAEIRKGDRKSDPRLIEIPTCILLEMETAFWLGTRS